MHVLPIAERELRVAARRPKTYYSRVMMALVASGIAAYLFWMFSHFSAGMGAGRQIFVLLTQFSFIYCLFIGVGATADCLSREKREGTMGLLFLTRLHSYDIVLGKLLANSLHAVYGIVATVPAFAVCLLIGGVLSGEFWRMVLALLNAAFFSLAVGLLVSAACRQERRATQTASGLMVLFGFALPALGEYLRIKTSAVELGLVLKTISPAETLQFSTIPTAGVRYFWWSLITVHLLAWAALAVACWVLPKSWQDKAPGPEVSSWRHRWRQWSLGSPQRRRAFRLRLLDVNPFYWLAARASLAAVETWFVLATVLLLAFWAGWFFRGIIPVFVLCVISASILHAALKMQVCAAACERLAEDKQTGTLEILLATPLGVRQILRGQWLALARQFLAPLATIILMTLTMLLLVVALREEDFFQDPEAPLNCVLVFISTSLMLLADAVALGWVGMWQALRAKQVMQARGQAIFYILFLPWMILVLLISALAASAAMGRITWMGGLQFVHYLGLWFVLGMLNNAIFAFRARRRLHEHFRLLATERYQPAPLDWLSWVPLKPLGSSFLSTR